MERGSPGLDSQTAGDEMGKMEQRLVEGRRHKDLLQDDEVRKACQNYKAVLTVAENCPATRVSDALGHCSAPRSSYEVLRC
jgi:hypothetical protein